MDLYLYIDRPSPIHRLDPRAKLLMLLGILLFAVSSDHPLVPAVMFALVLAAAQAAGAWRALKRVRTLLIVLSLFSLVAWSLFADGPTRLLGPVSLESLLYGVGTALKLATTVAGSFVFLATTRNEAIATGLIRLGLPYNAAFAFSTALRLVPTFVGAGATIVQAQRSRGLDVESGNIIQRMKKYLPLIVPIFASAIRSTNHLSMALESKGFGARRQRTFYLQLHLGAADWMMVCTGLLLIAASFLLRFSGYGKISGLLT
ncbi:MAG TPA: energy-coupling factor transporter transmembrane component T [Symbiobacteriaceae bacterium]|nr:energy-coupling factor transporter transmembrane component T [Symbiobacteriaceae bacterium]